jgi:hypothetical protein
MLKQVTVLSECRSVYRQASMDDEQAPVSRFPTPVLDVLLALDNQAGPRLLDGKSRSAGRYTSGKLVHLAP